MEAVIFIGIQASGKSTFYKTYLFRTHMRINLDMVKTRHREGIFLRACLEAQQRFVIDNTNVTVEERRRYIEPAKAAGFQIVGYYFQSRAADSLLRNQARPEAERIPVGGIFGAAKRLQIPTFAEGFDTLSYVSIDNIGDFSVQEWQDES
jgi:predicted kinase